MVRHTALVLLIPFFRRIFVDICCYSTTEFMLAFSCKLSSHPCGKYFSYTSSSLIKILWQNIHKLCMPPGNSRLGYQLKIRDDARFEMENCFQLSLSFNVGFRNDEDVYLNPGSHHHNYYFYFLNNVIDLGSLNNT